MLYQNLGIYLSKIYPVFILTGIVEYDNIFF